MSEDRDLMMEHRLLSVLREQAPEGLVAVRLSAAAKVSIDNTERLLRAAEREGIVTSFVNDDGRDVWKIAPAAVPLKDIDGSKPVEQLPEGDLRDLLREIDPFDLPDGCWLMDRTFLTDCLEIAYVMAPECDGSREWQVATASVGRDMYVLTDVPHPDDPDEEAVIVISFSWLLDGVVHALCAEASE